MATDISSTTELNKKGCGYRVAITRDALYLPGMNAEVSRASCMTESFIRLTKTRYTKFFELAKAHEATFVGARSRKDGVFALKSGERVTISLDYLDANGWPDDMQKYLSLSQRRRSTPEQLLSRLRAQAQAEHGELLSTEWRGSAALYQFQHASGETFEMSALSLKNNGWPTDVAKRNRRSAMRREEAARGRKTNDALYAEFQALVAANGAVLLTATWLGAKAPHLVQMADGSVKALKPNQVKHYGWPIAHLKELSNWAAEHSLVLVSPTWEGAGATYEVQLPNGFIVKGTPAELRAKFSKGLQQECDQALTWLANNNITLLTQHWCGLRATYPMRLADGTEVHLTITAARAGNIAGSSRELYIVRRKAKALNIQLLDKFWNTEGQYKWKLANGQEVSGTWADVQKLERQRQKLEKLKAIGESVQATLISTQWLGSTADYEWSFNGINFFANKLTLQNKIRKISAASWHYEKSV